jgi:hypothetical protein
MWFPIITAERHLLERATGARGFTIELGDEQLSQLRETLRRR